MTPLLVALLVAGAAPTVDELAGKSIQGAVSVPGARAELLALDGVPPRCSVERVEVPRPVTGSGRTSLRLWGRDRAGQRCDGWAWGRVRVRAPALVTGRALVQGDVLAGAVTVVERELPPGRTYVTELPDGARAARALAPGTPLEWGLIRVGPTPGDVVSVALRLGALHVEEPARAVACRSGRACAILPSGRRVEGIWHDGRIVLQSP